MQKKKIAMLTAALAACLSLARQICMPAKIVKHSKFLF